MKFDDLQQQQSYIGSSMTTPLNSVIESDCETADERCQMLSTLLMDEYTRTMDPARISCQPFHTIVTATWRLGVEETRNVKRSSNFSNFGFKIRIAYIQYSNLGLRSVHFCT